MSYTHSRIAAGVCCIPIPVDQGNSSCNIFILGSPEHAILVDAGLDSMAAELIATLGENGYRPGHVRAIIPTHAHQDHYGAAGALAEWSGAEVWAHPAAVPQMENAADHFNIWNQVMPASLEEFSGQQGRPVRVARLLREGDRIEHEGLSLQVLHTPGHERASITLFEPRLKIAFVGDAVQGGFDAAGNWLGLFSDAGAQRRSLERLRDLNPAILCKGHRQPRHGDDVQRDIAAALQRVDNIEAALIRALDESSPQPLGPLVRAAFLHVLGREIQTAPNYGAVSVHAFLLHLARQGRIRQTSDLLWEKV